MSAFHFLHPLWLIAVPVVLGLWLWVRRSARAAQRDTATGLAPHLAQALRLNAPSRTRLHPIDLVAVIGLLLTLGAAGPSWTRAPNPLIAQTAPLVVALKVTPSMQEADLPPSRAERARFKILDLITARAGAQTALVAYAGTAHRVAPLTEDPNILRPLLSSLSPAAMPVEGDNAPAALTIAQDILTDQPGAVLFVLDDLPPNAVQAFQDSPLPVLFLVVAPADQSLPQLSQIPGASVIRITPDDRDLHQIERKLRAAYASALAEDDQLEWQDRGWWLAWPAALLMLLWFRRGWTMRWAGIVLLAATLPAPARADGLADWFWTPDQQGQRALDHKDYARASTLFADPYLAGYALYKAGDYEQAATALAQLDSAQAAFTQGMALIKSRQYRPAIAAFETALERQPDYADATYNLELARYILTYVEDTRDASDTGEDTGIGADDTVYDNDEARGTDMQVQAQGEGDRPLTADQWISSIDTDMTKFLRSRFLFDNAQAKEGAE